MKKYLLWLAIAACVMLGLPWLAKTLVNGPDGMSVVFLLFFAVNPAFSLLIGSFAGANTKTLWSLPILTMILFLIGVWLFFSPGETAFYLYAVAYLVLGFLAMLISALIRKKSA